MTLNLAQELSKQGYSRKKNKSFLINKVKNYYTEDIIKKNNILFDDPNTFLKLPSETNFDYIINKVPRGPQYDLGDKLIPYTMVGNAKYLKKHKFQSAFGSKSFNRKIFKFKSRQSNLSKIQELKNGYNLITDKGIEEIFDSFKNKIKKNKNKYKDLIDKNECPQVMKQYIDKNLSLQEKCLKKNEDNLNYFKNLKENINNKMKMNYKNTNKRNNKSYNDNNSTNKDIQLSVDELLLNAGEEFKFINRIKYLKDKNNSHSEYSLPEVNKKWENSLRNAEQTDKHKKRIINFKLQNCPYWIYSSEKNLENISKNKNTNYSIYNDYSSRTNSMQNLFNHDYKKNQTNDDIYKNSFKKNFTSDLLEIQGKKLIDVEEKMNKNLKGKKRILKYKNFREEVKDMIIHSNFAYNNYHTSK